MLRSIGVVIPAHNEEQYIVQCLQAIGRARLLLQRTVQQVSVHVVVVLDSCEDRTQSLIAPFATHVTTLSCNYKNVGQTRAFGVEYAIEQGVDWIACTDADSEVDDYWLIRQYQHQPVDMICGVVSVSDWGTIDHARQRKYLDHYHDKMGHHHIHGANLSFSTKAYRYVDGFHALPCHEDVDLVERFRQANLHICWSNQVRVNTSSRLDARAQEGFAHFLSQL